MTSENGFWALQHDDLKAVLTRTDLSWETARVYLALADLTIGYRKTQDVVSLNQIAEHAGVERTHVNRSLKRLQTIGLYDEKVLSPQKVIRWVTWPPPSVTKAGTSTKVGNTAVTKTDNKTVTKINTHQKKRKNKRTPDPDFPPKNTQGFDAFWQAYPRRVSITRARKAWVKLNPGSELVGQILDAVEAQKEGGRLAGEIKFIPHPSTWINDEGWMDETPEQENPFGTWGATPEDIERLQALGAI